MLLSYQIIQRGILNFDWIAQISGGECLVNPQFIPRPMVSTASLELDREWDCS